MLLLHLSDIHFKASDLGHVMDHNQHLRNELEKDITQMFTRLGAAPDVIIMTGDIAFAGSKAEYAFASEWLKQLCEKIGAEYKNTIVVPGNHDISRAVSRTEVVQALHKRIKSTPTDGLYGVVKGLLDATESAEILYRSLADYNEFAAQFLCNLYPPDRTTTQRDLFLNDGSTLRITGLNSSFVSSEYDKELDLFVDHAYNRIIEESGIVNMVVCHHPYSWLRNGVILQRHLKNVAKIQLFGHEHTQRYEMNRDWILASASAMQPDQRSPDWDPGYNIMEILVEGHGDERKLAVTTHVRIWQENPTRFVPKFDKQNDYFLHKIDLGYWMPKAVFQEPQINESNSAKSTPLEEPAMASLREVAISFSQLTISDKTRIAKTLGLLLADDNEYPEIERFTRILKRAKDQNLLEQLRSEIAALKP